MPEPSRLARMTRIPSRSDQYKLPSWSWICLGVNASPGATMTTRLPPSRSARSIEPSLAARVTHIGPVQVPTQRVHDDAVGVACHIRHDRPQAGAAAADCQHMSIR